MMCTLLLIVLTAASVLRMTRAAVRTTYILPTLNGRSSPEPANGTCDAYQHNHRGWKRQTQYGWSVDLLWQFRRLDPTACILHTDMTGC